MTEIAEPRAGFRVIAQGSLADPRKQAALDKVTGRMRDERVEAWEELPQIEAVRERAHEARMKVVRDLDRYVGEFAASVRSAGGVVHEAASAEEAAAQVVAICRAHGATLAAKSKSMLSEEIGLNAALEAADIKVVETDLGEYLLQLAGEHPAHIIAPAAEKTAAQAAELLSKAGGKPLTTELDVLTRAAREQLRETFLAADVGITGANFGVCSTGSICLVENEGNARLVTALPRVHVALVGRERLVANLADLAVLLKLLPRSATGQRLTSYTTLITGPRRAGEQDGPEELHVIVVDNGRSSLLGGRYEEMLACIRCGACLNVCPVYRKAGGAAYSHAYSGPMGAVLVPLLAGLERAPSLPHASSLCGACTEACPVKIPLHELLLDLRDDLVRERVASRKERLAFTLWSFLWSHPAGYRATTWLARRLSPLAGLGGPGRTWARGRALPHLQRPFRRR